MILNGYSLYDAKAGLFSQPFWSVSDPAAIRSAVLMSQEPNSILGQYPRDFQLYCIGSFDDLAGSFVGSPPRDLGNLGGLREVVLG